MAIIDFFDRGWRINPTGVAFVQDDRRYSFNEVGELILPDRERPAGCRFPEGNQGRCLGGQ